MDGVYDPHGYSSRPVFNDALSTFIHEGAVSERFGVDGGIVRAWRQQVF